MYYIYLRKSRADGHESMTEVLARHERILQEYAVQHFGFLIPEEHIFREIVSGETIQDRPVMQNLLALIQNPDCQAVLVTDPQRLTRGDLHDCGTILRAFQYSQTKIITPVKIYDLDNKFDRKFFESELMHGNDYLEYTKEILLRGRLASVREGNYIGSGAPFGYDRIRSGKSYTLAENQESDAVRLIFSAYLHEHASPAQIAKKLDALGISPRKKAFWSASSIRSILQNPVYAGKIRWNCRKTVRCYQNGEIRKSRPVAPVSEQILISGKHPALIPETEFQEVQNLLQSGHHPKTAGRYALVNPFAGLCRCICGSALVMQKSKKFRPRLVCQNQSHCHQKSILYQEFEKIILQILKQQLPEIVCRRNPDGLKQKILHQQISEIHGQQEKLYDFLERGIYSEEIFLARQKALSEKYQHLACQLSEEETSTEILKLSDMLELLESPEMPASVKNQFFRSVIREIIYSRNEQISLKLVLRI